MLQTAVHSTIEEHGDIRIVHCKITLPGYQHRKKERTIVWREFVNNMFSDFSIITPNFKKHIRFIRIGEFLV